MVGLEGVVWWWGLQELGGAAVEAAGYVLAAVQSEQNRFALGGTLFSPMDNRMEKEQLKEQLIFYAPRRYGTVSLQFRKNLVS